MPLLHLSTLTQDLIATSLFLGGAIFLLAFATFSYMGLLPFFPPNRSAFYSGKHVLITGGSSGIGKELARVLIHAGASVTLVARNSTRLADAASHLEPPGESLAATARLNTFAADCADPDAVNRMVDHVERAFGPVDILVNAAGSAVGSYFDLTDPTAFDAQIRANYLSTVYPTHALFKRMARRRAGHLVFVSSMAGLTGVFGHTAYCSSKYAVRGFAESLLFEGKPFGIHVTIVYPPDTDTPGYHRETQTFPPETLEISSSGGLFAADSVARTIADGIMRKRFRVCFGIIGSLLGILTAGLTPNVSLIDVLVLPIARAISPLFLWDQNRIIRKGHKVRFPDINNKTSPESTATTTTTT